MHLSVSASLCCKNITTAFITSRQDCCDIAQEDIVKVLQCVQNYLAVVVTTPLHVSHCLPLTSGVSALAFCLIITSCNFKDISHDNRHFYVSNHPIYIHYLLLYQYQNSFDPLVLIYLQWNLGIWRLWNMSLLVLDQLNIYNITVI